MKSIKNIVSALIGIILLVGCEQKNPEFPDFDYTAVYFPHQYPVRTLSLGEEEYDNSLDQELKFHISANIGGMYQNKQDWIVEYEVLDSLAVGIEQGNGDTILALPSSMYTLTPQGQVTIPSGSFKGLIEVQLDAQFLEDPLAYGNHYVIPLVITGSTADSVLAGLPGEGLDAPDRLVPADWAVTPKDYVLFGIKYINPYHGTYFHRGVDFSFDTLGNPVDTAIYTTIYVVDSELWNLTTNGQNEVITNGIGQHGGSNSMKLIISENGQIQIDSISSSTYKALGTGTFVEDAERWGQKQRDAMYLSYEYYDGANILHRATDTLIYRNRGVKFEEFNPVKPSRAE